MAAGRECSYCIGLDLGTSATKGVLIASGQRALAEESEPVCLQRPAVGRVEFDAAAWFDGLLGLLGRLADRVPPGGRVVAIGIAAASGNTLLLDGEGAPLHACISWMDRRVVDHLPACLAGLDRRELHATVGWPFCDSFPLAHFAWIREERPDWLASAVRAGDSAAYAMLRLAGCYAIDTSTATPYLMQRQVDRVWHAPYADMLGIPVAMLPEILPCGSTLGPVLPEVAAASGIDPGAQVVCGSFDHPAAARALGVLAEGECLLSCGTSWVILQPVADRGRIVREGLLADPFRAPQGPWALMASLPRIGAVVDESAAWIAEDASGDRYAVFTAAAERAASGACFVDLLVDDAETIRACVDNDPARAARAVFESAAFLLRELFERLGRAGFPRPTALAAAGGPAGNKAWMRIVAAVTGLSVRVGAGRAAGAVGAANMAAAAVGLAAGPAFAGRTCSIEAPGPEKARYDELYRQWRRALGRIVCANG